ncbi:hypothetical protein C8J55DRAFT_294742 [Lentinula edodes]|uniref:Uncharacterized protein n=1 Tax=Lentinula lateritia TaxID=40482 RepID=A0A9W9DDB0_9AGAR|nr:hypothetical protein C8J55DRAFT_294742 [Lentinula edodes]
MSDIQEPQFDRLLAPMLFSLTVSAILFGVTIMQVLQYQRNSQRDPYVLKILVYFLLLLDITHMAFIIQGCYYYMVQHFANPLILILPTWGYTFAIYVTAVNNLLCQMFMCWRIWVLWKDQRIFAVPLIFFIILLAISAVAVGFVYAIMGWHSHTVEGFETKKTLVIVPKLGLLLILICNFLKTAIDVYCVFSTYSCRHFDYFHFVLASLPQVSTIQANKVYYQTCNSLFHQFLFIDHIMQLMVLISVIAWPNTEIWVTSR